jgi:mannose-6-phosphate isomerase-like protein (cupin superfamily)/heme-degrading monooxygenase HmoA
MKKIKLLFAFIFIVSIAQAQSLQKRIVSNDPSKYRSLTAVHAGAGKMGFTQLVGRNDLSTNFLYLHSGTIEGKSGIGHHFHHNIEEMYVLLSGEAEFTINGRTAKIKAPAVVPCKMGDSHAIYNRTNQPVKWLNYAVSLVKGKSDNFDLGDSRENASAEATSSFVYGRLETDKLKTNNTAYQGSGVMYRRVIGSEVFSTDWNHVDHVVIPAATSATRKLEGIEEVYYVVKGAGSVAIGIEKQAFKKDDVFSGMLGESLTINSYSGSELELLVIGVAASKQKMMNINKPLIKPKAIGLQMDFVVPKENAEAFEKMYYSIYVPAMTVQPGYLGSKCLRLFSENIQKEIQAEPTNYNYQIQISFDTEDNRRAWVASPQHKIAWPAASGLAKEFKWRGYDIMGDDDVK